MKKGFWFPKDIKRYVIKQRIMSQTELTKKIYEKEMVRMVIKNVGWYM